MPSEPPTRENASNNLPVVLDDPVSRKYISVLPYHGYDFKNFAKIQAIHVKYPGFPLWMTELCYAYEAGFPKSTLLPARDFADGDFWGKEIFNDLEASTSAGIYWNMILDERGGPWAVSKIHENPDPNAQHPIVIIDRTTKQTTYTGLYYYLAHFSKFVRPGAVRVDTTGSQGGVRVMAFRSPTGDIVAEVMNSNKIATPVDIAFNHRLLHLDLPGVSISTAVWRPANEQKRSSK